MALGHERMVGKAKLFDGALGFVSIRVLQLVDRILAQCRAALQGLRAPAIDSVSLEQALTNFWNESKSPGAQFRILVYGNSKALNPKIQEQVYLITREALANAFYHAAPAHIEVEIAYELSALRVRIRDDGCGIDPEILKARNQPGRWGLQEMRERSKRIGATLVIRSRPGAGAEVLLEIPEKTAYLPEVGHAFWTS
jgi:signal transduction histidine kinase